LKEFKKLSDQNEAKIYFVMLPQLNDLKKIKNGNKFYRDFLNEANQILPTFDFSEKLAQEDNLSSLYSDDRWGGHYSVYGNQLLAQFLAEKI
jgi:hypothetical protein